MNSLNFNRMYFLFARQLMFNIRVTMLALLAICGPVALVSFIYFYLQQSSALGLKDFFMTFFFIGGFVYTSKVFSELHSPSKSYAYLTLPVSNTERLAVSWFLSSPLYALFFSSFVLAILFLSNITSHQHISVLEIFDSNYFIKVSVYLALQPIFLLGACHFRKNNFLKTVLSIFIFILILLVFTVALAYALFGDQGFNFNYNPEISSGIIEMILFAITGAFFLLVTYFKLKEREI